LGVGVLIKENHNEKENQDPFHKLVIWFVENGLSLPIYEIINPYNQNGLANARIH
jgi:hypothetical protein